MKKAPLLGVALACLSHASGAGLQVTFDDLPAGQPPVELITGRGIRPVGDLRVVDAASTPADPFGGAANHSLLIDKTTDEVPTAAFRIDEGVKQGQVSLRFKAESPADPKLAPRAFIALRSNDQTALTLQMSGARFSYLGPKGGAILFDQKVKMDESNALVLEFDVEAGTFEGSLNGETLTEHGNAHFSLPAKVPEINIISFAVGTKGSSTFRLFVDEIAIKDKAAPAVASAAAQAPAPPAPKVPADTVTLDVTMPADPADLPAGDQRPARVYLDFDKILPQVKLSGLPDLSTLKVVGCDAKGNPVKGARYAYGSSPEEVPLRWDDAAIPTNFQEVESAVDAVTGELKRTLHERLGASYNVTGDGRAGFLVWTHTKPANGQPAHYRISFEVPRNADAVRGAPPHAWIGDGVPRFIKDPPSTTGFQHTRLAVTDWNGDGKPDLVYGEIYGHVVVMLNQGTATQPNFPEQRFVSDAEGNPIDAGLGAAPLCVDWDGDGVEDLLVGTHWDRILFYRNIGTNAQRKLEYQGLVKIGDAPLEVPHEPVVGRPAGVFQRDYYPMLEAVDWDGDGDLDLLVGGYVTGRIFLFENTGTKGAPNLVSRGPLTADGKILNVGDWAAAPTVADFNGDGLPDLITGCFPMSRESQQKKTLLKYYVNTGRPGAPELSERPFPYEGAFPRSSLHSPRAVDFNGDGLLDLAMSAGDKIYLFPNIGTKTDPKFRVNEDYLRPAWGNAPLPVAQFIDWKKDGQVDIFSDNYTILLNDGTGDPFFFSKRINLLPPGKTIAHPSGIGDDWFEPVIADFDGDGDLDVLFGDWFGQIWYHEHRPDGSFDLAGKLLRLESGEPIKVGPKGEDPSKSFRALQGARTVLTTADFNGDGLKDLVVGDTFGLVHFFANVGTAQEPKFREEKNVGDLKQRLSVDTVDWNGDGQPDIIAGSANGAVQVFLNSGKKQADHVFASGFTPELPKITQPRVMPADLNGDGDTDLFFPSTQGSVFVERSFLTHGYTEAASVTPEAPR